jgi:ATP-dependent Clp protease ATP-binding subunit ClpA
MNDNTTNNQYMNAAQNQPVQQPVQQQSFQPATPVQEHQAAPQHATTNDIPTGMDVTKRDVENVVSSWTGIPISKLTEDESAKLLQLEDRIHQRLIDQEEAVVKVSEAVRRGRIGLASGQRPIASFIFLGPSGTGKTELAKTLAEILFGRDDAMIRLDMSEYMEKHEVAKLIGAPPGYVGYEEGGQLTEAVRAKPYSIVLLDEVEKAHPDVFNVLLQLLEDGRLTDNKGNTISFKNTIVICTSNIGSALITEKLGEKDAKAKKTQEQYAKEFAELSDLVNVELRKFFRPELLNRYDDIVIFKPLRREDMVGIAKRGIEKTAKLLKEQGFSVQITDRALAKLAREGYDPMYGARPLRRLVQGSIENPVALEIIGKRFTIGDTIRIDFDETKNQFIFLNTSGAKPQTNAATQGQPPVTNQSPFPQGQIATPPVQAYSQQMPQTPVPPVVTATQFDPMSVLSADTQQQPNPYMQPQQIIPQPLQGGAGAVDGGMPQTSTVQFGGQPVSTMVNEVADKTFWNSFSEEWQKE